MTVLKNPDCAVEAAADFPRTQMGVGKKSGDKNTLSAEKEIRALYGSLHLEGDPTASSRLAICGYAIGADQDMSMCERSILASKAPSP